MAVLRPVVSSNAAPAGLIRRRAVIGLARGIASLAGNWIRHTFTPDETLPAFLWVTVRDGLPATVRK